MTPPPSAGATPEERRIAELYHARSMEEPPSRVDAAIRAAARAPTGPARRMQPWWLPWRVPFAVAAVAVVSGTLALLVHDERPDTIAEAPPLIVAPAPPITVTPVPPASQTAPAAPPAFSDRADSRIASAEPSQKKRASEEAKLSGAVDARPQADTVPAEAPARRLEAENVARESQSTEAKAAVAGAAQQSTAPRAFSAPPAPAARAKMDFRDAVDITALKTELDREPPRRWIERIAALRREGRAAEAEALLAEFGRRFPNEPLPPATE